MEKYDLRLTGGEVFLEGHGTSTVDILIRDGRIAALTEPDAANDATEIVDITGKLVLPGGIDPHVHLGKDIRVPRDPDDAERETASAVAGGVTSILTYLMSSNSYVSEFEDAQAVMSGNSHANFGFHFVLGTPEHLEEFKDYMNLGVSSFKFFMNFRGDEGAYLGMPGNDDSFMYELLKKSAEHGAMINPHPENIELVRMLSDSTRDDSLPPLEAWNAARPPFVEADAAQRVAYLASVTGASVYCVHTSSNEALQAIARQRAAYPNLFIETCTQYLTLDTSSDVGVYAKVNPPVRPREDVESLWTAFANGQIDTVGSDHNARHRSNKDKSIWDASAGFPGMGTLVPMTLAEGLRRKISLATIVDAISTRSAKLFGMYPQKGLIAVGSDADLTVIDLNKPTKITAETQHSAADYTPWEGTEIPLSVAHTLVGGRFALRDGALTDICAGKYISRPHSGAAALEGRPS
ncbi:amidohydrolase family protein [Arthrobacter sp. APC 3897]|uniref:dihydroorotase n=1 Tax=Arthrobacter sp. APC 3897 TaxID=3035204 RepID=UPI0025B5AB5E|nr:amidohydrolase family protein [Arthrobacter sp. APC 3897]MDN3480651.1 amidohydrolase family protein [Arthrobacter sp. APC 3897]